MKPFQRTLLIAVCLIHFSFTQTITTINSDDILNQIGSIETDAIGYATDSTDAIMVDVGSPGVNQSWDLRNVVLPDTFYIDTVKHYNPQQTDLADLFPNSNYAVSRTTEKITSTDTIKNYALGVNFRKITPEKSIKVGDLSYNIHNNLMDTLISYDRDTTLLPEKIEFGTISLSVFRDTTYVESQSSGTQTIGTIEIDSSLNTIDGYGIIKLPLGDFKCFRIRSDLKITIIRYTGGFSYSYTITYIGYTWSNYKGIQLASITSLPNKTDPFFTKAGAFLRLESINSSTVAIKDIENQPNEYKLSPNYPNPFNPTTRISFTIPKKGHVTLIVYSILGQKVATLVNGIKQPGSYEVNFNGSKLSSGIYFYRLTTGQNVQTKKMILLK